MLNVDIDGINPAKVYMHEMCNTVLSLMQTEEIEQLSYLLGRFDMALMLGEALGILNAAEIAVLRERREAVPGQRAAAGLDAK